MTTSVSQTEAELYDRQIRVWGLEAQSRLKQGRVWILSLTPTGLEVAKNLILTGVGSIFLVDNHIVTEDDLTSSYFLSPNSIGSPRSSSALGPLQELNPNCKVSVQSDLDPNQEDLVIFCDKHVDTSLFDSLNSKKIAHLWCWSHCRLGIVALNFLDFSFVYEDQRSSVTYTNLNTVLSKLNSLTFPRRISPYIGCSLLLLSNYCLGKPLPSVTEVTANVLPRLSSKLSNGIEESFSRAVADFDSPTLYPCAMTIGGFAAQEAVKFFTKTSATINNVIVLDIDQGSAPILPI
ncbi:hypothetical protein GEMRC1_012386 [Eukaryota sp. GEM-RC1]